VCGDLVISAVSSPTGALTLTGLPFTVGNDATADGYAPAAVYFLSLGSAINAGQGLAVQGETILRIQNFNGTTGADMAGSIAVNTQIGINLTYSV